MSSVGPSVNQCWVSVGLSVIPIESSVLAQTGKNKHVNETGPANQKQAFKHRVIFPPAER